MRTRFSGLALILCLGLGTLLVIPTGAAEPADAKKIEKLIERLGGDDFADREKATAELDALGAAALPALKKATDNKDVEVSKRAADLVAKIEKRGEAVRLLAPKKVHLVYKDMAVADAAADFAKKSGYTITLYDPEGKLKDRKITLDTGEVTFWQAVDLFCDKAGLGEMDPNQGFPGPGIRPLPPIRVVPIQPLPPVIQPVPAIPPALPPQTTPAQPPKKGAPAVPPPQKDEQPQAAVNRVAVAPVAVAVQGQAVPGAPGQAPGGIGIAVGAPPMGPGGIGIAPGNPVVGPGGIGIGWNPNVQNHVILVDGKPRTTATDNSGAVRVRVMEKADVFGPANEKEILLGLEVKAEPKLQIQVLQNVRVEKAMDDKGQNLTQAVAEVPAIPNGPGPRALPAIPVRRGFFFGNTMIPLHLKKGEKESKSLKELTGVISAQVLAPAAAAITADKIMDAAGKEFKGAEGGKIKVLEVTKADNGQITVKFELEQPPAVFPANPFGPVNGPFPLPGGRPVPLPPGALPLPPPVPGAKPVFQAQPAQALPIQIQVQPGQVQVRPGVVVVGPVGAPAPTIAPFPGNANNGIALEDEKGNAVQVIAVNAIFRRDPRGAVVEHTMVFQPQKDQKPAKLVFSGSKIVTIDIPFTLKNVTLP
jgi:hypothetical protein